MSEPALAREAIAWAAGLFEGEGTVGCHRARDRHRLAAAILMTDRDRLEAFGAAVGLGHIIPDQARRPLHYKPLWRWYISGHENVQALAAVLWPWLGPRRRDQIRVALSCYRSNSAGTKRVQLTEAERGPSEQRRFLRRQALRRVATT